MQSKTTRVLALGDDSVIYDCRDLNAEWADRFPTDAPYVFETNEEQRCFATEEEAAKAQRIFRREHGFNEITGEREEITNNR